MKTQILNNITHREREILLNISMGLTANEIAESLFVSSHTIKSHRKNLMRKLEARNTAGLMRIAFETGLLELPQRMAS